MKEKIYNIFRILGIICLGFCTLFLLVSYVWDFGDLKIGTNIFLFVNLAYIILLIINGFNKKVNAEANLIIWIMFISYIIYLYASKILGESMFFAYIIILLFLSTFGTYKLKKKEKTDSNKSTNITLVIISIIMITYMFFVSYRFLKTFDNY